MSVHQVIFTSCKRGISGVNDGQQIFSHNADFTDYAADSIRRLYTYQVPRLEAGVAMTEEIAATMPQSFTYRKVDDSKSAIALGTYLGRDYMGSAGRFGNFLSHVIVADDGDITNYPCEFYGSIMLRSSMEYEEVNNPDRPDYLPSPTLETGYDINIFSVIDFLSEDDRMSVYINMLYALLSRKNENKKVVILDEPENIIMWIAALEYALPLKAALNISFTTYEYDPNYSLSQICGVIANGTNFSLANKDRFFTFDMQNNDYPEFDTSSEYFDFIRTAFDDSYDILEAFHSFMVNDVGYWGDDLSIITAFIIYKFSLKAITFEQLNSVISFERNHGYISSSPTVAQKILEQKNDLRNTSDDIFFTAIDYVIEQLGASFKDDDIVSIIIHRVVQSFCTSTNESDFSSVYDRANSTLNKLGINLTDKLISNSITKNDMLNSIISSAGVWKEIRYIKLTNDYILAKDEPIKVCLDQNFMNSYFDLIAFLYKKDSKEGMEIIKEILEKFSFDERAPLLVTGSLSKRLEKIDSEVANKLWSNLIDSIAHKNEEEIKLTYTFFMKNGEYENVFKLFDIRLKQNTTGKTLNKALEIHLKEYVLPNREYATKYQARIMQSYYNQIDKLMYEDKAALKTQLLEMLLENNIKVQFADELIDDILDDVVYAGLTSKSNKQTKFIENAVEYTTEVLKEPLSGSLLDIALGIKLVSVASPKDFKDKMPTLKEYVKYEKANISSISSHNIDSYLNWIADTMSKICNSAEGMCDFYDFFEMSENIKQQFFAKCTDIYIKRSKSKGSYTGFIMYFGFASNCGDSKIIARIGKDLSVLNKNKLAELDEQMKAYYKKEPDIYAYWKKARDKAESTNPILHKMFGKK